MSSLKSLQRAGNSKVRYVNPTPSININGKPLPDSKFFDNPKETTINGGTLPELVIENHKKETFIYKLKEFYDKNKKIVNITAVIFLVFVVYKIFKNKK